MVDLLVQTSSDHLILILKLYLSFYKTVQHNEEVSGTEPSPSGRVLCLYVKLCWESTVFIYGFSMFSPS